MLDKEKHDLEAWDQLTCTLVFLMENRPADKVAYSAACLLGGYVACLEVQGEAIPLDDVRKQFQDGYDDYFEKKRNGAFDGLRTEGPKNDQ